MCIIIIIIIIIITLETCSRLLALDQTRVEPTPCPTCFYDDFSVGSYVGVSSRLICDKRLVQLAELFI